MRVTMMMMMMMLLSGSGHILCCIQRSSPPNHLRKRLPAITSLMLCVLRWMIQVQTGDWVQKLTLLTTASLC